MSTSGENSSTDPPETERAEKLRSMWDIANSYDDSENEDVAELGTLLVHLLSENDKLRSRVSKLEDRLSSVERHVGVSGEAEVTVESPSFDRRDRAVLEVLAERNPDRVHINEIQKLYRKKTDVRRKYTLRERVSDLIDEGPFEETDKLQQWRYVGE